MLNNLPMLFTYYFQDMHGNADGKLLPDSQQDCREFYVDSRSKCIVFERNFDTCDDHHDYVIEVTIALRSFVKFQVFC